MGCWDLSKIEIKENVAIGLKILPWAAVTKFFVGNFTATLRRSTRYPWLAEYLH